MKLRLASILAASAGVALFACGGDESGDSDTVNPDGARTQYVADTVNLPTNASSALQLGLDLDDDDVADNALGQNLSLLVSMGVDLQGALDESIADGSISVLAELQAVALDNATGVGMRFFLGENPNPAACTDPDNIATCGQHLDGNGSFDVSADSPTNALIVGQLLGGTFETTVHGTVTLELELVEGVPPIGLELIGARTAFSVSASGIMSGRLGGAIEEQVARDEILPLIVDLVQETAAEDCTGTAPPCCTAGTTGATIMSIFDTDPTDCVISDAEVEDNDLIGTVLSPDVDLVDGSGTFNPNSDEIDDSISLGLGFTGVGATFTAP